MKVVINTCCGGFSLSSIAAQALGLRSVYGVDQTIEARSNPDLVRIVEQMGEQANGMSARLKVVEIPDGVKVRIGEYDGVEWIEETHRTWR